MNRQYIEHLFEMLDAAGPHKPAVRGLVDELEGCVIRMMAEIDSAVAEVARLQAALSMILTGQAEDEMRYNIQFDLTDDDRNKIRKILAHAEALAEEVVTLVPHVRPEEAARAERLSVKSIANQLAGEYLTTQNWRSPDEIARDLVVYLHVR